MIVENKLLIATRVVGKGDTWKVLHNNSIQNSLTDALESYFQYENRINVGGNIDFYLVPIEGKLFVVDKKEVEEVKKRYNIYGEEI